MGNAVGAATAAYFLSASDKVKYTLATTVFLNSGCLFAFAVNPNFYLAILLRFLTGFLQIFLCVFGPVWVDRYAPEHAKSMQLTFLMLATPLGVVFGYGLAYAMIKYANWRWAYYIQLILAVPEALGLLAFVIIRHEISRAKRPFRSPADDY